jgi:hypothetical protein
MIGAIAFVLVRNGIRFPWLWVFLVAALGNHFLFRMQAARSHVLSVLLLLLGIHFLLQSMWRWLAAIGFIYSWSYSAPHLLVAFAAIDALARWAIDRRFEWRGLAWSAGGVLAGLVVNPYFPNDLTNWWIINVRILGQAWNLGGDVGLTLGAEFEPISPRSLIVSSTLVMICFLGTFLAAALRRGALSRRSQILAAFMVGGFLLYCMSARFVEYFAPLALLAAASVTSDLWPGEGRWNWRRISVACAAGVLAIGLGVMSLTRAHDAVAATPSPQLSRAATWIRYNVPAGETIAHLDWGDFVQLFYFDPTHNYLVGLDPMFMFVKNPRSMRLLRDIRDGREPLDPAELAKTFNSRYLVVRTRLREIPDSSGLTPVFEDAGAAVYRLDEHLE